MCVVNVGGELSHGVRLRLCSKEHEKEEEREWEKKGNVKRILIIVFGEWRGHSRDLAEEVKSSQVDTSVSDVSVLWHWWCGKTAERTLRSAGEKRESCPDIPGQ